MARHRIKCAHCKGIHTTAREVAFCAHIVARATVAAANVKAAPVTRKPVPARPDPHQWTLKTPLAMVENLKEGRYATQLDSHTPHMFFRVTRPKRGRFKDTLLIQTQHGETYMPAVVIYPTGRTYIARPQVDHNLLLACADPMTATMKYGQELGVCCRCGKELTDERSRHYGIGPECEKYWPEIITYVNENKGVFSL